MRRVEYTHPHYPRQRRRGEVKHEGPDGCVVVNDETGLEERVRHRDIKRDLDGDTREDVLKSVAHGFLAYATPETLANIAADYQDQYAPGHPASLDASECDWHYDPAFPLANLPGTPEEWRAWHALNDRQIGFIENPTPLVVAQGTDGHHYLWDGNHRTGEAHAAFWTHVPAIVGRSRIRDDQPDLESPPGSVERSGLRMSRRPSRPLYLTRRGQRGGWAIRLHAVAFAKAVEVRQMAGRQHIHRERYPEGHGHMGEGIAEYGHGHIDVHQGDQVAMIHPVGERHHESRSAPQRPAAPVVRAPAPQDPVAPTHVAHAPVRPGIATGNRLAVSHHTPQHVAVRNLTTGEHHEMPTQEWHRHLASGTVGAHHEMRKAMPPLGFPTTPAQIPQAPQPGADPVVGEWPQLARPRYAKNQHVQYQRPDMPAPAVGRIISHGDTDGTWIQPVGTDGRHPVRWDHIHGAATVGVSPEERKVGAQVLAKMGVPVDPLEHALLPDRAERPNPHLLARVQALVADGAPIDPAAIKTLGAVALHRVLEHYAGPLPREEQQRPQRDFRAQKSRLRPWADD